MKLRKEEWVRKYVNGEDTSWYRENCITPGCFVTEEQVMNNYLLEFYLRYGIFKKFQDKGKIVYDYSQFTYTNDDGPKCPHMFVINHKTIKVKYCDSDKGVDRLLKNKNMKKFDHIIYYNADSGKIIDWRTRDDKFTELYNTVYPSDFTAIFKMGWM